MNSSKPLHSLVLLSVLLAIPLLRAEQIPQETSTQQESNSPNKPQTAANTAKAHKPKITPPKIIKIAEPHFSDSFLKARYQCIAQVHLYVETNGEPSNTRVIRIRILDRKGYEISNPDSTTDGQEFIKVAVETVSQFRFKPSTKDGIPVRAELNFEFNPGPLTE